MKRKHIRTAALFVLLPGIMGLVACSDANQRGTYRAHQMGDYDHSGMMGYDHSGAMGYDHSGMMGYDQ